MSFLAYIPRFSNTALSSYSSVLFEIAVRLVKDCPSEAVAMKRDFVIATRHIPVARRSSRGWTLSSKSTF